MTPSLRRTPRDLFVWLSFGALATSACAGSPAPEAAGSPNPAASTPTSVPATSTTPPTPPTTAPATDPATSSSTDPVATPPPVTSVDADSASTGPPSPDIGDLVADFLDGLPEEGFDGVVAIRHADATTTRAFGMADPDAGTPIDTDTVFDIGSITKQFTGAAIVRLEMDGRLSVDDRLGDHLDGLPDHQADITLHQLLTHTSGLPGGLGGDYDAVHLDAFIQIVAQTELLDQPGARYEYSNPGYSLLAAVVEQVTGNSYETYLREALFEPAGMEHTGYVLPDWDGMTIAAGIDAVSGETLERPNELPWAADGPYWHLRGNGGILSTADDMFRWHEALLGDSVLDADAKAKLFAEHVREGPGAPSYYGYGWAILHPDPAGTLITHNGGNGTFFADFLRFVDNDLTIFLASNNATEESEPVAYQLADLILGTTLAAEMGGNDDLCGFRQWHPDQLPPAEELRELPDTEPGAAVEQFLTLLAMGDEADRIRFATDHVDPAITGDAPPEAVAGEIALLQDEFEGFEVAAILQSAPEWFHLLMESPDDTVLVSLGTTEQLPGRLACVDIAYRGDE